jgi:hypothetical protein
MWLLLLPLLLPLLALLLVALVLVALLVLVELVQVLVLQLLHERLLLLLLLALRLGTRGFCGVLLLQLRLLLGLAERALDIGEPLGDALKVVLA